MPNEQEFALAIGRLQTEATTSLMPAAGTQREADLFDALTLIFLEPRRSAPVRRAISHAFGEPNLEVLTAFLAFVRTAHYWTETHPDLEIEPDMLALLKDHAELERRLLDQSDAERTWSPMERARLLSALAARDAQRELLLKIAQAHRETGDAGRIRAMAAEAVGKHLDTSLCAFIAVDRDAPPVLAEHWTTGAAPSAEVVACCTAAVRKGAPIIVSDTASELASTTLAKEGVRAVLCLPLEREGAVKGCLLVGDANFRQWTDAEVDLVRDAAARTSEAVERAEAEAALREERRTLETLNEVGTILAGELDLERVVQMVTDAGVELTGAHAGTFFYNVLDPNGESYMLYTLSGVDRAEFADFAMPRNTSVFAPTFAGEGVLRSDDILTDGRYGKNAPHQGMPKGHLPVRSYLAVPVVSRSGEVLGGLFFGHPEPGRFQARHERLIVAIAAQAAIAIDNARLFKEAQSDLQDRRAAEAELQELNETLEERIAKATAERVEVEEALRQSQKLEAVGQLTGGVAHDFNNLLTIIRSSIDYFKRPDLAAARRDRYVTAISDTVERASKLTGQLLAFARRQPMKPEIFDVGARVQSVTELIRPLAGSRVDIVVDPCMTPCFTKADASQFETALVNLAVNARDAMNGEGHLTLRVREVEEVPSIRGHLGSKGDFVAVSVSDTGTGIAPEMIASIFEPFFTTKDVGKGTGLGLSQVFGFTKQSGGEIDVQSVHGAGATFTIYLPSVSPEQLAAHLPPPAAILLPESLRSICVLLVEDNEVVGRFADEMLKDLGYSTHLVGNAHEALAALASSDARYDVVFSDVIMPGMNGVDLAKEVRRRRPEVPIVLTSGYSNVLAQEGSHGFELLRKPYSIEELSTILRRVVTLDPAFADAASEAR